MSHTTNDWELIVQWLTQAQINVLLCALFYTWLNDVYQNPWVRSAALIMTFTMIARIIQGVDAVLPTLILTTATVGAIGFFKYKPDENKALSLLSLALTPD